MRRLGRAGLMLTAALAAVSIPPLASATELEDRQDVIDYELTHKPDSHSHGFRVNCAMGGTQKWLDKLRKAGAEGHPDAVDECLATLYGIARHGDLLTFYRDLQQTNEGDPGMAAQMPGAIGSAVLKMNQMEVPISATKLATITPALALDAGFTAAYLQGQGVPAWAPSTDALRQIAVTCFDQTQPVLKRCYSVGFIYGTKAHAGEGIEAR